MSSKTDDFVNAYVSTFALAIVAGLILIALLIIHAIFVPVEEPEEEPSITTEEVEIQEAYGSGAVSNTAFSELERETCRKKRKITNTGYFERLTRQIWLNAEFMREVERRKKERTWTGIGD